jgi:hypothetical protein
MIGNPNLYAPVLELLMTLYKIVQGVRKVEPNDQRTKNYIQKVSILLEPSFFVKQFNENLEILAKKRNNVSNVGNFDLFMSLRNFLVQDSIEIHYSENIIQNFMEIMLDAKLDVEYISFYLSTLLEDIKVKGAILTTLIDLILKKSGKLTDERALAVLRKFYSDADYYTICLIRDSLKNNTLLVVLKFFFLKINFDQSTLNAINNDKELIETLMEMIMELGFYKPVFSILNKICIELPEKQQLIFSKLFDLTYEKYDLVVKRMGSSVRSYLEYASKLLIICVPAVNFEIEMIKKIMCAQNPPSQYRAELVISIGNKFPDLRETIFEELLSSPRGLSEYRLKIFRELNGYYLPSETLADPLVNMVKGRNYLFNIISIINPKEAHDILEQTKKEIANLQSEQACKDFQDLISNHMQSSEYNHNNVKKIARVSLLRSVPIVFHENALKFYLEKSKILEFKVDDSKRKRVIELIQALREQAISCGVENDLYLTTWLQLNREEINLKPKDSKDLQKIFKILSSYLGAATDAHEIKRNFEIHSTYLTQSSATLKVTGKELNKLRPQSVYDNKDIKISNTQQSSENLLKSHRSDSYVLKTARDGNCAFHAILGDDLDGKGFLQCKGIEKIRQNVAGIIRRIDANSPMCSAVLEGIEQLLNEERGFQVLKKKRQECNIKNQQMINDAWKLLEEELRKHQPIMHFIENGTNLRTDLPELRNKFIYALNLDQGKLYGMISSHPQLSEKFKSFNKALNEGFNLLNEVLKDKSILDEYADHMQKLGQWLLPCELPIIAYAFHKNVKFYTYNPYTDRLSESMDINPDANEMVAVRFNGENHFERIDINLLNSSTNRIRVSNSESKDSKDNKEEKTIQKSSKPNDNDNRNSAPLPKPPG